MPKLSPTVEEIDALRKAGPSGPVVMVNLLKFRQDGGREAYARYQQVTAPLLPEGTQVLYLGKAGADIADGEDWDAVGLAQYTSFDAFAGMVASAAYQQQAVPIRPAALEKTLFMASYPADAGELINHPGTCVAPSHDAAASRKLSPTVEELAALRKTVPPGPVVMVNLLKFRGEQGRIAYAHYARAGSAAAVPGMRVVYSGRAGADLGDGESWDFVVLMEYPSFDAFADMASSPIYQQRAIPFRPAALERTLFMISQQATMAEVLAPE